MNKNYLEDLQNYIPATKPPLDFADFWLAALKDDLEDKPQLMLEPVPYPLKQVELFAARLTAGDGVILNGWYLRPAGGRDLPALVRYHGYSSNSGQPSELLLWALQGYAVLGLDVRGQCGRTPDGRRYARGQYAGWMTLGILDPNEYYYRQVYLDAVRAVLALAGQPEVNPRKIGLFGKSQGGGLALIAGALLSRAGREIAAVLPDSAEVGVKAIAAGIPFLCDFPLAYSLAQDGPLAELRQYFRMCDPEHRTHEQVFHTLNYFDCIHFAPWIEAPVLVSVGLLDTACPPQTIFGMYNLIPGKKEMAVYPDYGHESIDPFVDRQIALFAREILNIA